jgi:hypothetical protein
VPAISLADRYPWQGGRGGGQAGGGKQASTAQEHGVNFLR